MFAVFGELMPLFQTGILMLVPTLRWLQRHYGVQDLDQIIGVPEMVQMRQQAEQAVDGEQQPGAPGGAGAGGDLTPEQLAMIMQAMKSVQSPPTGGTVPRGATTPRGAMAQAFAPLTAAS